MTNDDHIRHQEEQDAADREQVDLSQAEDRRWVSAALAAEYLARRYPRSFAGGASNDD